MLLICNGTAEMPPPRVFTAKTEKSKFMSWGNLESNKDPPLLKLRTFKMDHGLIANQYLVQRNPNGLIHLITSSTRQLKGIKISKDKLLVKVERYKRINTLFIYSFLRNPFLLKKMIIIIIIIMPLIKSLMETFFHNLWSMSNEMTKSSVTM